MTADDRLLHRQNSLKESYKPTNGVYSAPGSTLMLESGSAAMVDTDVIVVGLTVKDWADVVHWKMSNAQPEALTR